MSGTYNAPLLGVAYCSLVLSLVCLSAELGLAAYIHTYIIKVIVPCLWTRSKIVDNLLVTVVSILNC